MSRFFFVLLALLLPASAMSEVGSTPAERLGQAVQFETVKPLTADGKIHLTPAVLGPRPYQYLDLDGEGYPLALISPASGRLVTSTFGEFNLETLEATIHPNDAAARGILSGENVRVFNDRGEVVCRARVSDGVRPGVVSMPKGAWRKASVNGLTSTALCPDDTQVVANGACFNDARVEIAPAGVHVPEQQ